jgi:hypothetical protein
MSLIHSATVLAAETHEVVNELPMPAPLFGLLALVVFALLALVVWSYRNVANRHVQVSGRRGGDGSGHTSAHGG